MKYAMVFLFFFATSEIHAQQVTIPVQVGTVPHRVQYATPLRNFLFGKYRFTPIYEPRLYQIVTPPPRPVYVQPPSYLVPIQPGGKSYPTYYGGLVR